MDKDNEQQKITAFRDKVIGVVEKQMAQKFQEVMDNAPDEEVRRKLVERAKSLTIERFLRELEKGKDLISRVVQRELN